MSYLVLLAFWLLPHSSVAQTGLAPLFAAPTPAEIDAVEEDWAARDVRPAGWEVVDESFSGGFLVQLVRTTLDGVDSYGVLRFPRRLPRGEPARVVVLHHGGTSGFQLSFVLEFDEDHPQQCLADSALIVAPTYRDETFLGGGGLSPGASDGEASPFDRDCDDAMAMLEAVLANVPEADPRRVTSWGRSRGANVAWHMMLRDPRVRRTAAYFAPTDFRHVDVQAKCQTAVDTGVPTTDSLAKRVMSFIVEPWLAGQTTLTEARHVLTAWSVVPFLDEPAAIQIHHGENDGKVPVDHALAAAQALVAAGAVAPEFAAFTYPGGGHDTEGLTGHAERTEPYLCQEMTITTVELPFVPQLVAEPNPFSERVWLRINNETLKHKKSITCDIIDLVGRRMTTLILAPESTWDGRDARGRPVPSGSYLVVPRDRRLGVTRLTKFN